jgi:hypothetical protein
MLELLDDGPQHARMPLMWGVPGPSHYFVPGAHLQVSAPLENEAIAPLENEATQTDWLGDPLWRIGR